MNNNLKNIFGILIGNTIYALAVILFVVPNELITGGSTGLAIAANHLFNIPITLFVSIFNILMFLMGYRNAYRICVKEGNRINMYSDESRPNEHINLPMPVISCRFNDEKTIKQLSEFQKNKKNGGGVNE